MKINPEHISKHLPLSLDYFVNKSAYFYLTCNLDCPRSYL
jgi:hypothetical protein